ncbi:protein FAM81B [Trichomycterus rosablanca]|uniref:protein FAM81B n=1 Tax=Trichomycterus rosablanca TaxID=2290929 RepID=UPI002F358C58
MSRSELTLATLMEKAFRIKEDMVKGLQSTQGSVLMEASARKLLENHIQTITHIVKQLSKDIQVLESQIVQRDSVATGTTFAVQSLDHKNVAVVGDLRGRVARCDATIAKLSADVRAEGQEILTLQQEVSEMRSKSELRLKDLEIKISESLERLESSQSKQISSHNNTTGDLQRNIKELEIKISNELRELEDEAARIRRWTEQQLNTTVQTQMQRSQQLHTLLQDRVVEVEVKLNAQVEQLSTQLGRLEKQLIKERSGDRANRIEYKLNTRIDALEKSFQEEVDQIKRNYQSGFQSVHDAIDSLRHIGETKAKIDKEELKKDLRQIRQMMTGLPDV